MATSLLSYERPRDGGHAKGAARLDKAFARLGLGDPESHLRIAIASWPLAAVVEGIAVFEGKKKAGTLPEDEPTADPKGVCGCDAGASGLLWLWLGLFARRRRRGCLSSLRGSS